MYVCKYVQIRVRHTAVHALITRQALPHKRSVGSTSLTWDGHAAGTIRLAQVHHFLLLCNDPAVRAQRVA